MPERIPSLLIGVRRSPEHAIAVSPRPICEFGLYVFDHFFPSAALGVGNRPIFAAIANVGRSLAFSLKDLFTLPLPLSIAVGVGNMAKSTNSVRPSLLQVFRPCVCGVGSKPCNDPHPVSLMWRADGTSRNNKRLDGISRTLKVFTDDFDCEVLFRSVYVILLE